MSLPAPLPTRRSRHSRHSRQGSAAPVAPALVAGLVAAWLAGGCGAESTPAPGGALDLGEHYLAVANASLDFQTGSLGALSLPDLVPRPDLTSLHSDSAVRSSGGFLFGINRMGADNLQRIEPSTFATVWQYSVEPGSNPQDVAVIDPHRAYVTRYERADIWIVDPSAEREADFHRGSIDLSEWADADGVPELGAMVTLARQGRTWVVAQRLDRHAGFAPRNDSLLVAIDHASDAVAEVVTLPVPNPVAMAAQADVLWIACTGTVEELDGAVLRYDTVRGELLGDAVSEAELGGDLAAVVPGAPGELAFVVWSDAEFVSHVGAVEPESGALVATLADDLGFIDQIAADDRFVFVPDRSPDSPGLRIFDRATLQPITSSPIRTGLPPWSMAIVER